MNRILIFFVAILLCGCHDKINEVELDGNHYDRDFTGNPAHLDYPYDIIEILEVDSQNSNDTCFMLIKFRFLEHAHRQLILSSPRYPVFLKFEEERFHQDPCFLAILDESLNPIDFRREGLFDLGIHFFGDIEIGQPLWFKGREETDEFTLQVRFGSSNISRQEIKLECN